MRNIYENNIMIPYRELLAGGLLVQEYAGLGGYANPIPTIFELNNPKEFQLQRAGMYPPNGIYKLDARGGYAGNKIAAVTMMMPKGDIPRLRNTMGTEIVYAVAKNGEMVTDTSTGSKPPSGVYGSCQRVKFSFAQKYGQVCFNLKHGRRMGDVFVQNISADGEWCIKFYSDKNPDGDTAPVASKYVLAQSGNTTFSLKTDDRPDGPSVSAIGIMSNGCTKLSFDEIYATDWDMYNSSSELIPARYCPIQPGLDFSTKWYSEYELTNAQDVIYNSGNNLPINIVTYIMKGKAVAGEYSSVDQIPLSMFQNI